MEPNSNPRMNNPLIQTADYTTFEICIANGDVERRVHEPTKDGLTLRDYFASAAMAAIISKYPPEDQTTAQATCFKATALGAYNYADAMLAQRLVELVNHTTTMDLDELKTKIDEAQQMGAVKAHISDDYDLVFSSNETSVLTVTSEDLDPE